MFNFLGKLLDSNQKELTRLSKIVDEINALEPAIKKLTDEQLRGKTEELRKKAQGPILPQAFAVAREAIYRVVGERAFDVQLMAAIALHEGKIAEQKTGEGKTLSAAIAMYLNALTGRGVHLVTVNDYLARRDTGWYGKALNFLGLKIGCIIPYQAFILDPDYTDPKHEHDDRLAHLRPSSRREAYQADVTYGTNNEFGFDYLRDNMVSDISQMAQTNALGEQGIHNFAIVDEVDFALIDEARTPLIISAPAEESNEFYLRFAQLVPKLIPEDYVIDEKEKSVILTDAGVKKMEKWLATQNLYEDFTLAHHLEEALKAQHLYHRDKDYLVKENEVIIVDEFTGRLMEGRRYSEGLHQAIEAKEGVPIQKESKTLATITFQNYFRMYEKLAGMTGTAATEAEEFHKIYNLEVIVVPTNELMIRKDPADLVYKTQGAKFKAIADSISEKYKKGQPVLVGTTSVEKNELVAQLLSRRKIPHEILNAKNHEREAEIINKAGNKGAVTIATNLAGRGTDIKLGNGVVELGGLHVVGTERHEARRIDNQLRGRSGRQGDPGSSRFFVSLDDDLMRVFGGDKVASLMTRFNLPEDVPIEAGMVSKAIENAQVKVEGFNFDIRKHLVEYDDVINKQREIIYKRRRSLLKAGFNIAQNGQEKQFDLRLQILSKLESQVRVDVTANINTQTNEVNYEQIVKEFTTILPLSEGHAINLKSKVLSLESPDEIISYLTDLIHQTYEAREKQLGPELMRQIERVVSLSCLDHLWMEHIDALDELRTGIGLRGYGQRDPLVEFKNEAYQMFERLLTSIDYEIVHRIFKVQIAVRPQAAIPEETRGVHQEVAAFTPQPSAVGQQPQQSKQPIVKSEKEKIGRNDPCWCGATRPDGTPIKYKHCHGKNL